MINYKYIKRTKKIRNIYTVENLQIIINNLDIEYRNNIMYYSLFYCKKMINKRDIDIIINPYNYYIKRPSQYIIKLIIECFTNNNPLNINNEEYKELEYIKKYIYMFIFYYINKNEYITDTLKTLELFEINIYNYLEIIKHN